MASFTWNTPMQLGGLHLKNRILKAATHDASDFESMRRTYVRLAKNDVSLITVAYVAVSKKNKTFDNQHHIAEDNLKEWTSLCSSVHEAGGRMSAQLHHPGLFCMCSEGVPMGPSFFWLPSKLAWPRVMGPAELKEVKEQFVAAAHMCMKAGFDCLELHCGHGYLLSQFLTPMINRRWDEYGGTPERRARFPCEIMESIREVVGKDFPILIKMNVDDGITWGGLQLDQALKIAKVFANAGADGIIPSYGYTSLNGFGMLRGNVPLEKIVEAAPTGSKTITKMLGPYIVPSIEFESLFLRTEAQAFARALHGTGTKIIYIGGADSMPAIEAVLGDGCDAVQIGRPLIREPFFVKKMARAVAEFESLLHEKGGSVGPEDRQILEVGSRCIRCNMCTLASMDPKKFKAGCPFAKDDDGIGIEDIEDLKQLTVVRL